MIVFLIVAGFALLGLVFYIANSANIGDMESVEYHAALKLLHPKYYYRTLTLVDPSTYNTVMQDIAEDRQKYASLEDKKLKFHIYSWLHYFEKQANDGLKWHNEYHANSVSRAEVDKKYLEMDKKAKTLLSKRGINGNME